MGIYCYQRTACCLWHILTFSIWVWFEGLVLQTFKGITFSTKGEPYILQTDFAFSEFVRTCEKDMQLKGDWLYFRGTANFLMEKKHKNKYNWGGKKSGLNGKGRRELDHIVSTPASRLCVLSWPHSVWQAVWEVPEPQKTNMHRQTHNFTCAHFTIHKCIALKCIVGTYFSKDHLKWQCTLYVCGI